MKLQVNELVNNSKDYNYKVYKVVSKEYCCDSMKVVAQQKRVMLQAYDDSDYGVQKTNNIYPALVLNYVDSFMLDDDLTDESYTYKIDYCPFCGEPICIEIVSSKDITKEYDEIADLRESLNNKRWKTDSQKEEQKYSSEISKLDSELREYEHDDVIAIEDD
jgi:hypothetical protein